MKQFKEDIEKRLTQWLVEHPEDGEIKALLPTPAKSIKTTAILSSARDALECRYEHLLSSDAPGKYSAIRALAWEIGKQSDDIDQDYRLLKEHCTYQILSGLMKECSLADYSDRCSHEHLLHIFDQAIALCVMTDDFSNSLC